MNTTHLQTISLLPARNRLRLVGDTTKSGKLTDELAMDEHMKELAPTCHYHGWHQDCTRMLDLL
jgi:hypothetical protein